MGTETINEYQTNRSGAITSKKNNPLDGDGNWQIIIAVRIFIYICKKNNPLDGDGNQYIN